MTNKTKLSEEVESYVSMRDHALSEVVDRITKENSDDDRVLMLDGLGFTVEQEDRCARITLGVSNIAAFTEELIARGEPWTDHLAKLPDDLREQVLSTECDLTQSGALHSHDCYTITNRETGEEFPLWLSQVIYQCDTPILEAFYVGHEEGHILHKTEDLWVLYTLWTEHLDELVNSGCLNLREDALVILLNTAMELESMDDNPAVTEAVAHLGGLFAAFQKYDTQDNS